MSNCTYTLINENIENACSFIKDNCEYSYINFYELHYCYLDQNLFLIIPILLIILFVCFYLLSDTSNKYLSPALTFMSDKLNMSQNLAGVTFLALGNGAPDVISSIVASDDESGGIEFSVGSLIGAGVFVSCIVFSSVVMFAGEVKINKKLFIRDIILYFISILILIIFSWNGSINLISAIGFFSLYIINVSIAVWQDNREKRIEKVIKDSTIPVNQDISLETQLPNKRKESKVSFASSLNESNNSSLNDSGYIPLENNDISVNYELNNRENELADAEGNMQNSYEIIARRITKKVIQTQHDHHNDGSSHMITNKLIEKNRNIPKSTENEENKDDFTPEDEEHVMAFSGIKNNPEALREDHFYRNENTNIRNNPKKQLKRSKSVFSTILHHQFNSIKYRLKRNYFSSEDSWEEKGFFHKINFIFIDFPFTFLRDITIPAVELDKWNRIFFMIQPITATLFILLITKTIGIVAENWYITIGVFSGLLTLTIIICRLTYRNKLPRGLFFICLIAFVMSIFWIWSVAKLLLDILDFIGTIFNIPNAFLGMTLLSFGNSVPDLTLNCALARAGYGEMGIAGSIAGPLFNLLIGLGASLIKKTIQHGPVPFQIFSYDKASVLVAIGLLAVNLLRLLIHSSILKFKLTKSVSYLGYLIYIVFFVCICLLTFVLTTNPFL